MGDIIDLGRARFLKYEHLEGEAVCAGCLHTWQAAAPIGTTYLECPGCRAMRGVFRRNVNRNTPVRTCSCEGQLFYVAPEGLYCARCGDWLPEL